MVRIVLAVAILSAQLLYADVIVTDGPMQRFLVIWNGPKSKIEMKSCASLPDDARARDCEAKRNSPAQGNFGKIVDEVEKYLTTDLKAKSLSEISLALEKKQSQLNSKRVIDLGSLTHEKNELEEDQSRLVALERFRKALDGEDFEIDVESKNAVERNLGLTISYTFSEIAVEEENRARAEARKAKNETQPAQNEEPKKYKTTFGPLRGSRYYAGWLTGSGVRAKYSGYYSFTVADSDATIVVHREDADGRLLRNAVLLCKRYIYISGIICDDTAGSEKHTVYIQGSLAQINIDGGLFGTISEERT